MKDALGRFQTILVLGGGSEIAAATVLELLRSGPSTVILAAREPERLDTAEFEALGATIERVRFDARAYGTHREVLDEIFSRHGDVDLILLAFGVLGRQDELERDAQATVALLETNMVGAASALMLTVEHLRAQGHGSVVVFSSVAGQRARRSNFVYGASKAGLDALAAGLQLALAKTAVKVMIVRPGFVHTKMTKGLARVPLSVSAPVAAAAIVAGLSQGADIVWVPRAMRVVSLVLRVAPRGLARLL